MNATEILQLLTANPAFHLATLDRGEPRVRGMLLYRADAEGIVFHTGTMKEVCRQLREEPAVELCFFDPQRMIQVRVRGRARWLDDLHLKNKIVTAPGREFLKPWVESQGLDILQVFRVEECRARVWTMATNFEVPEPVALGGQPG